MDGTEEEVKTEAQSQIQRQLTEYRKKMQAKRAQFEQAEKESAGESTVKEQLLVKEEPEQPPSPLRINQSTYQPGTAPGPTSPPVQQQPTTTGVYVPPMLRTEDSEPMLIRETNKEKETSPLLLSSDSCTSIVSISQLPILNVIDLTKASLNARRLRLGNITQPEDLDSEIVPDHKISEKDLVLLEREVNKKKRKRAKAQKQGDMISPLSPPSRAEPEQQRRNNDDEDLDMELGGRDQMVMDQLVNNPMQAEINRNNNRQERTCLCGLFRTRRNGHYDIICLKDMHPDFIYMLLLAVGISACLTLYAVLQ